MRKSRLNILLKGMVRTGEGMKANLHLRAKGVSDETAVPFQLGINVKIRGSGTDS